MSVSFQGSHEAQPDSSATTLAISSKAWRWGVFFLPSSFLALKCMFWKVSRFSLMSTAQPVEWLLKLPELVVRRL